MFVVVVVYLCYRKCKKRKIRHQNLEPKTASIHKVNWFSVRCDMCVSDVLQACVVENSAMRHYMIH